MTTTTLHDDDAAPADPRVRCGFGGRGPGWNYGPNADWARHGPPPPVKALGVLVAFLIFPPLGLIALGFLAWKAWQRYHNGGSASFGPFGHQGVENSAFRAHRREVLNKLDTEARELAAHERAEREARDRAALDAFRAAQASKAAESGKDAANG
jgi:hypothetical protein